MADDDYRFIGPNGRLHLFRWSKDCWYGRVPGCCTLCKFRHLAVALRYRLFR